MDFLIEYLELNIWKFTVMKIKACSNLHVTQQERKCAVHYFKRSFNSERKSNNVCRI